MGGFIVTTPIRLILYIIYIAPPLLSPSAPFPPALVIMEMGSHELFAPCGLEPPSS
jgi:hypothetical protein